MPDDASDRSETLPWTHGVCPECGEYGILFLFNHGDGRSAAVVRWWRDGRPARIRYMIDGVRQVVPLSREEYDEAVERAAERTRDSEHGCHFAALDCEANSHRFDRADIVDPDD